MGKGADTRATILHHGLDLASTVGLEGVTIGVLAQKASLSKSGLYAHFGSKEQLQCAVLDAAADSFVDRVVAPSLKQPRGLPRIHALFDHWVIWLTQTFSGGCPFIAAATELDDRPGPVRDHLIGHLNDLLGFIERAAQIAVQEGQLRADLDVSQFAYDFWANLVAFHHYDRLFRSPQALERGRAGLQRILNTST